MTKQDLQKEFNISENCINICNTIHKIEENRKTFKLDSSKLTDEKFWHIQVDDCMIKTSDFKKCDAAFIRIKKIKPLIREFYFVELKNDDIDTGYKQIIETIEKHFNRPPKNICYAFIVASGNPKFNRKRQKYIKEFSIKYGKQLIIQNNVYIYSPQ